MGIVAVQLGDIHILNSSDTFNQNKSELAKAIASKAPENGALILILNGDIAFSGLAIQFDLMLSVLEEIESKVQEIKKCQTYVIPCPGNHDCDFKNEDSVRKHLTKNCRDARSGELAIDWSFVDHCCSVLDNFGEFRDLVSPAGCQKVSNSLVSLYEIEINSKKIAVSAYNSAWMSSLNETAGALDFPVELMRESFEVPDSDLSIGLIHHPLNWFKPETSRALAQFLEAHHDLVVTGHEHQGDASRAEIKPATSTFWLDGQVVQEHGAKELGSFQLLDIDVDNSRILLDELKWSSGLGFRTCGGARVWDFFASKSKSCGLPDIKPEVLKELEKPGANFTHPRSSILAIDDLYVFPDLKRNNKDPSSEDQDIVPAQRLTSIEFAKASVISGSDRSGKTSLLRQLFKSYYRSGLVPVIISGESIKNTSPESIFRYVYQSFAQTYEFDTDDVYERLEPNSKVILVDDIDHSKLNEEALAKVLNFLQGRFFTLIVTESTGFRTEALLSKYLSLYPGFSDIKQYKILQFGHKKRDELIHKWNAIGREDSLSTREAQELRDESAALVNTLLGTSFVPAYPLFLLIILQSGEASLPHQLQGSAYGHYYEFLLTQSLRKAALSPDDLNTYHKYMTELSFSFFRSVNREISSERLEEFHRNHCEKYDVNISFEKLIDILIKADILEKSVGLFRYKYEYIFYFFISKYFASRLHEGDVREAITRMCDRPHVLEFANILMFLVHHSNDPFVLEQINASANQLFGHLEPANLDSDFEPINNLINKAPEIALEDGDVEEKRSERLHKRDKVESREKARIEPSDDLQARLEDEVPELDFVSKVNIAFKEIDILGQILKNYHGSLEATTKVEIGKNAYELGLRSLTGFFEAVLSDLDGVVNSIRVILEEKGITDRDDAADLARKLVFRLSSMACFGFIKRISRSVGSKKLQATYRKVLLERESVATKLVDLAIRLENPMGSPIEKIRELNHELRGNVLGDLLLKELVLDYLYMFDTEFGEKQQLCSELGIKMSAQMNIDLTSRVKRPSRRVGRSSPRKKKRHSR
ncbi:STAND family AAA ATPase [Salinisphaera sp. RV14]|uniref:STAND family AAA ATPase n=1 Tax=Salinisphaera sp. RV14 TaxID=3454140 RepID=UPI003F83168F